MRFTGSDMRETLNAVSTNTEMGIVEALLKASGSTWEGVAFEARSMMDGMGVTLDDEAQQVAQAMFLGGYLSGLAQCVTTVRLPDERAA